MKVVRTSYHLGVYLSTPLVHNAGPSYLLSLLSFLSLDS